MVKVEYHDDLKEVQCDNALSSLLSAEMQAAPFDRLAWWQGLAEQCDLLPLIAVASLGTAQLVLPLHRVARRIETLSNWYTFRVRPVTSPDADRDCLLTAMAIDLIGEAPRITLAPMPDEDGSATATAAAFSKAGWLVFTERCDWNHVLEVKGRSYAEYLTSRPGPLRTTLKRKSARVSVSISAHFDAAEWKEYEAIYAESWKPREGSPAFLRRFAEEEAKSGRLRLGLARTHDGAAVAAQFWTVEGNTAFIHKLAHTEESKPLSAGTTLTAALFAHVIDNDRVSLVDFGTGDDPYKRDWMEDVRPRFRLDMLHPGWPGNWPIIARSYANRGISRLAGRRAHV